MARPGRPRKFKQGQNTSVCIRGKRRFTEQDGKLYTYSEFNRMTRCWEPEPQPIDEDELERITVLAEVQNIEKEIQRLMAEKAKLMPEKGDGE